MQNVVMLFVIYADWQFMVSVASKLNMLSVIMVNVVMLKVIMLKVVMLKVVMLNVVVPWCSTLG